MITTPTPTTAEEDTGYIRSESIGYDLDMVIGGLIEAYDSVVEGNGRIAILSNFWNYFIYFTVLIRNNIPHRLGDFVYCERP
jgi:hypothetical protein